jgi:hypothetical protein
MCDFFLRDLKFFFTSLLPKSLLKLLLALIALILFFTIPCFCLCSSLDNVEYLYCERKEALSTDRKTPFATKI